MLFKNGAIRYLIIWYAIILHLIQGSLLVASDTAGFVTSTAHVRIWLRISAEGLGVFYLGVAVVALLSITLLPRLSLGRILALLPQQVLITLAAAGALVSIADSQFADGVVRSRYFIGADQCPIIISAVLHSAAVLDGRLEVLWKSLRSR